MKKYTGYLTAFLVVLASFACAKVPVSVVSIQDLLKEIIFIYRAESPGSSTQTTEQKTQSPYAPIKEGSNIYVYQSLTPENLAEFLIVPGTEESIGAYVSDVYRVDIKRVEFGQTKEQLEKLIEWSYEQAATHTDEDGFSVSYPLNKEQLEKLIEKTSLPVFLQEYNGEPKKEDGKICITPIEEGNKAYISTGIITESDSKLEEDPYCDYEVLLESTINPKTGEIERTEILPKRRTTYNTPYNEEGIKELEEWGYEDLLVDTLVKRYIGDRYEYPSEIKSYIVGCIIKEGDTHKIYFSPASIWHIHIKNN